MQTSEALITGRITGGEHGWPFAAATFDLSGVDHAFGRRERRGKRLPDLARNLQLAGQPVPRAARNDAKRHLPERKL